MLTHSRSKRPLSSLTLLVSLPISAALFGACGEAGSEYVGALRSETIGRASQALTCPSGNGLYTLYYGTSDTDIAAIRAARPNFVVVANESTEWPDKYHFDNPVERTGETGIKVIAYIPMNYAMANRCSDVTPNTTCTNLSCKSSCDDCLPIQTRIANAMSRNYDGVFFDETNSTYNAYNAACYQAVKAHGAGKLVIANPGSVPQTASLFDAADIVSVENKYNVKLPSFPGVGPERWLAIQGDPASEAATSLADAQDRLNAFRANGGFWYYSASPHWQVPSWFGPFATWVEAQANVSCEAPPVLTQLSHWGAWNDGVNVSYRFDFAQPFTWYRVYIDTDQSAATGFARGGIGADYLIENMTLYRHAGAGWNWSAVGSAGQTLSGTSTSWTVARASLGQTTYPNTDVVVFEAQSSGGPADMTASYQHVYSASNGAITATFAHNDGENLFYQANFAAPYIRTHVFIDVDTQVSTGYSFGGIGADYMIENDRLYRSTGPGWSWTQVASTPAWVGATGTKIWSVPRPTLGENAAMGETANLVFHGSGGATEYATPVYHHVYSR